MRRCVTVLIPACVLVLALSVPSIEGAAKKTATKKATTKPAGADTTAGKEEVAVIETNMGRIVFKFFPKEAPLTVKSFKTLARKGFYDGCTFHRVIPGFMIQGGDPYSKDEDRSNDGLGGPGFTVKAEFNWHKHVRGAVSMARSQDPNSAGSQFFIVQKDALGLDNQYTVFGDVIEGMDVVDKIANVKRDARDNPIEKVVMQKVYVEWRPKK